MKEKETQKINKLTFNQEKEANHTHGCNNKAWYNEGKAPVRRDPVAGY